MLEARPMTATQDLSRHGDSDSVSHQTFLQTKRPEGRTTDKLPTEEAATSVSLSIALALGG